ncbi:hypothetical protein B0T44_01385 [Nocardia donostiensis]|uniref:Uncharacterized protein n=1 Tax=Nocardia donostiensis TaxID=1538463 RepID=A0A1W0BP87_9NOCA|nr:hypothetical protein B0T46_16655 [Nocardia donostiensis]OQS15117.1 hypothetical protein B0T36_10650 [Nocardia donostiensis]OQS24290.1 hypothetical protein B0T44_01385 [Nocardia donostiensis]
MTSTPYTLAADDILRLGTSHSLGSVDQQEALGVDLIKNWYPDFAFTHLFHLMLEEHKSVFTWDEFQEWARGAEVRQWLWEPAQAKVGEAQAHGFTHAQARNAMRWRLGIFYYSFLRELYVIASLREHGLPLLCHPLADALFRVDAWCGNVLLELFIANREFKAGNSGRKLKTASFFTDQPQFVVVPFEMQRQRIFGQVHLPGQVQIQRCVAAMQRALDQQGGGAVTQ